MDFTISASYIKKQPGVGYPGCYVKGVKCFYHVRNLWSSNRIYCQQPNPPALPKSFVGAFSWICHLRS
jgi:hypothetical protein